MALQIVITNAGRAEIINADNTGTGPVVITEVGFGTGQYSPAKTQTALLAEVKRVSTIAGLVVADDTIHVVAKDEGADAYNVGEFGLFSASGTLVAVYSQLAGAGWIIQKAGASTLLLATDIILESLDATSLTFGDVTFVNPPATTTSPGVVQLENSLTSSSTAKALTAAQGKSLQDGKQPVNANLSALASLVGTADKLPYFTGLGTMGLIDITALLPPSAVVSFARNTAPTGWLKANGAAVSRSAYAALFAAIGSTFGAGDGSTTFNLPDLRGEFIRGWDNSRGIDAGRAFGTAQLDEIKSHSHAFNYGNKGITPSSGNVFPYGAGENNSAISSSGGAETRPRNVALLTCIKY